MRAVKTGLVAAAGVLMLSGCHGGSRSSAAVDPSASAPTVSLPATGTATPATSSAPGTAVEVASASTLADTTTYYKGAEELYAVHGSTVRLVMRSESQQNVSPDGKHIVSLDEGGLAVTDINGRNRHLFRMNLTENGFQSQTDPGPYWTSDSQSVVVSRIDGYDAQRVPRTTSGTVRISDGSFKAFPKSIQGHSEYRISGDGQRVLYLDKCRIFSAKIDGTGIKPVPTIGLESTAANPSRLEACDLGTVNRDGSQVTAVVFRMGPGNKEPGLPQVLIDTATGKVLPRAFEGYVEAALIRVDNSLLVRSNIGKDQPKYVLTLFSADGTKIASRPEPKLARDAVLNSYSD